MDCGVPQDIGTFCKPMDWSVCQTEPTWKVWRPPQLAPRKRAPKSQVLTFMFHTFLQAQAAVAEATFNEIVNASGFTPATISKACATQLASLQCAKAFPACEIADEVKRVCPAECHKVTKPQLLLVVPPHTVHAHSCALSPPCRSLMYAMAWTPT